MAFVFVQGTTNSAFSGTTVSATFSSPVTAGNAILIGMMLTPNTLAFSSVGDGTNSYTIGTCKTLTAGNSNAGFAFALNAAHTTPTITLTASGTVAGATIWIEEWSGIATTNAYDGCNATATAGGGNPGDAFSAGSFTPTTNGDLIWAWSNTAQGGGSNVGAGYAAGFNDNANSSYISEFLTQGTAGAINPNFTAIGGSFAYYAAAAAFKAPAGAPALDTSTSMAIYRVRDGDWRW